MTWPMGLIAFVVAIAVVQVVVKLVVWILDEAYGFVPNVGNGSEGAEHEGIVPGRCPSCDAEHPPFGTYGG